MDKKQETEIKVKNPRIFFRKKVTKFGTGAKIDCPKEYLEKEAYVIIID
jgi:putative transposon-encoded protein